jgi:hypothetical protein
MNFGSHPWLDTVHLKTIVRNKEHSDWGHLSLDGSPSLCKPSPALYAEAYGDIWIQMMLWRYFQVVIWKKLFSSYLTPAELFRWSHTFWSLIKLDNGHSTFRVSFVTGERNSVRSEDSGALTLIFFTTTAPFYLFDEIHAALDTQ